ncbi:hypothetical protein KFL_003940110 [Klebsormidium nitens]|uniref:Protein MCM10 homolog n=1 Tax=Klebsormidium nitens TaxID=105231 RepID=A0A1Y1IAS4_KLENI|nr:hypothetical protein KFL_003940110 [Klebsormidium nitens]|eukprot:GAQ88020.1 hypothetical protein KFL_003940110 [Klebsormidium nitens]
MEDDDTDLLLALQPDDAELGNAQTSAFEVEAAGSPPGPAGGTSARAYHSPEVDKTLGPRSRVSLSAAFGTARAGTEEKAKAKVQKTAAPAREAPKGKPRQIPGKGDNVEPHSGLKIKNPLLPSIVVKERFAGSRFLRLSKISSAFQGGTPASPWATAAVLSEKMTPRESASGRKYGLWKVTDLAGFTCSLFLFGDAFEAHWKESEGSVVGLLNAKYKEEKGGARSSAPFCLSAENGQQVFKLGTSADLGLCRGTRKDGMPCTMPINKSEGEYCQYHAAGAYQKLQKLQKAQEKGHRMDLGKGKLSREPHGRVMNNVFVSAPPAPLPRVGKSGAVNVVKPGQLQEQAEQEQRKRSNSQGSRQALAVAASIQRQQEKKADKDRNKAPSKHMTNGAIRPGPAKAPIAARAGTGPNADVTRKDKVTSVPKPASAFDRQALAGKENLKRVAGATLGLDERERKRQQLERNRLRAEGNGARTEQRDVRTGADGIRTERSEVPLRADGIRLERNGMRAGSEGTGAVAGGSRTERNGMRTELDGNRPERRDERTKADGDWTERDGLRRETDGVPEAAERKNARRNEEGTERDSNDGNAGSLHEPPEGDHQTADGCGSVKMGASTPKMENGEAARGKLTEEVLRAALKGEAVRGKLTEEALKAALKGEAEEAPRLRIEKMRSEAAGVVEPKVRTNETGKRGEELERQKDAGTERGKGTEKDGGQESLKGRGIGASGEGGSKTNAGERLKTGSGTERLPNVRTPDGEGRGKDHVQPTERPERETLTQRKHRIAARVAKMDDRGMRAVGGLKGSVRRPNAPESVDRLASNGLKEKGGTSEKRPTPDGVEQAAKRPGFETSSEREGLKPSRGTASVDENAGLSSRQEAGRERKETVREQLHSEKTGSGRNNGATERGPESGTGVPSAKGPSDNVSKAADAEASRKRPSDDVSKAAEAEASRKRATDGGEAGGDQEKERPYKCAYCESRFKTGAARRSHEHTSATCINQQVMRELSAKGNEGHGDAKKQKPDVVEPATKSSPKVEERVPTEFSEMRPRVQKRTLEGPPREDVARLKRRIVEESAKLSAQEREELVDLLRSNNKEGRSIIAGQRIKKVSASSGEGKERDPQEGGQGPRVRPADGHVAIKKGFAAAFRDVAGMEEGPRESVFRDMGDAEEIERALGSFDILEKKEELAAKMDKIQSVTVKGWRCDQCRRSTEKKPDLCVSEHHPVRFCPKLVKRFWACAVCKERTDTVGKEYPDVHCRKCDGMHFKPTGMRYAVPTKETAYAARENFMARGKEHAFSLRDE